MKTLLRSFLRIDVAETNYVRRGFRGGDAQAIANIEAIGAAFLHGYHVALGSDSIAATIASLETTDAPFRGFRYEGAAMVLYLLDRLLPGKRDRFDTFIADRGADHIYMAYVGAGWAHARLPFGLGGALARRDPLLRWLMLDGYGFHQGFFHWRTAVEGSQHVPWRVRGYARRAFDQGLGRSLWFVDGHEPDRVAATIATFASSRHADLWAGAGLAATYAGGVPAVSLQRLAVCAGPYRDWLAQGSAFAAAARQRAGNVVPHTDDACRAFCGRDVQTVAGLVESVRLELPADDAKQPAYEIWRQRTRDVVAAAPARAPPLWMSDEPTEGSAAFAH